MFERKKKKYHMYLRFAKLENTHLQSICKYLMSKQHQQV